MQYNDYLRMRNFTVTTEDKGEYQPERKSIFTKDGVLRFLRNTSNTTNSGTGLIKVTVLNYLTHYGALTTASAITGLPLVVIPATPIMLSGVNPVSIFRSIYSKYDNKISEIIFKLKNRFRDKKISYTESGESYADKFKLDKKNKYLVNVDNGKVFIYGKPEGYDSDLELFTEVNKLVNSGITEYKVITGEQLKKLIPKQYLME